MKKILQLIAFMALIAVPWAASAQTPCTPNPSSKDGNGITNVTFGTGSETVNSSVTWSSSPFYNDYSSQIGAVPAGTACEMSITYATGYSYGTIIWVDWNSSNTFDSNEVVWVGSSTNSNPTTLAVNFDIPVTQDTGTYLMRICAADMAFDSYTGSIAAAAAANPCESYSWGVALDYTLRVTEAPSCLAVDSFAVSMTDVSSITVAWVDNANSSASYTITCWPEGASSSDDTITTTTSANEVTVSGLNTNTLYYFSIVANCSANEESLPRTTSGRTDCGAMTLPFSDNFDSYANGFWPPCWHRLISHGTDPSVNAQYHHSGTQSMFLLAQDDTNLFVTPSTIPTLGNNIYVRYHAYMDWSSWSTYNMWIKAGVMTDTSDVTTFIALDSVGYHNFNSVFEEREFNTSTLDPSETYWVAWMFTSNDSYYKGAVDDVYISEIPSCLRVASIGVDTITDESITLTWVDGVNSGASYTVSYWTATGDTNTVTTSDTSYLFSDLTANTPYFFSVVVNCGSEDAEAVTASFRTACGPTAIPFLEDFEDEGALSCWKMVNCASSTGRTTSNAHTGSACFHFSYNTNPPQYLISPELSGTDDGVKVDFYYKQGTSYTETFQVGYSTTSDSAAAFVWGEVMTATSSYQLFSAIYPAGTKYVSIKLLSNDQLYLYIDDINFMLPPSCMPVSQLYVDSAVTANSATIYWTAPENQNNFIVRLNDNVYYNTSDTFYTFTALSERTLYNVAVASDCSGDTSEWQSTSFITGCAGGECEITVISSDEYNYGSNYSPKLHVFQNGAELANICGATEIVGVCTGMPVVVINEDPTYSWSTPQATIINGGDEEVFNGATNDYSTGDTLVYMANACPSCLKPMNVIPSVVDSSEITFTWTVESGISYLLSFDDGAWFTNNTGSYTAYGLNPNTLHTFAVKAVCGVGDTSNPRIVNVKSACGEMAIPYVESFEGDAFGDVPSCWTVVNDGANGFPKIDDNGYTGEKSLTFVSNLSNTAMIASSRIPLAGDSIKVSFRAYEYYGTGTFEAGMMTNPYVDSTFISLATITASDYTFYEFNTNTLEHDSSYYLAFRYASTDTWYYAKVDDVVITLDEGCMTPTDVTVTPDSTSFDITVTWTNSGSLNSFVVEYREYGDSVWSSPVYTTTTSKTITGLHPATTYEVRVGQPCGADTLWGNIDFATTMCAQIAVPYVENFVSATGTLPPCWSYTDESKFHWNRWTTHAETSGDGEMMAGSNSAGEAAILPLFYAPFVKLQISFKAKLGNVSEGDGIMMGAYNETTNTVEWLDTLTNPGQSRENFVVFSYNYLGYNGTATRIAIGHSHNNASDWGFALDSIVVVELATCNPPENLEAHNTMYPNTADDVYFTWTVANTESSTPNQWQLYIDTITSTINIDSVPASALITVDTTYYMPPINTLAEGAHYRLFVRSLCGGEYSAWVELQNGFSTDVFWMNNSTTFDTIVGCDFIIFDNGGPVAGYLHNSNSNLVIQAGEPGRELQLQGAYFSHGADPNSFTVYDGIGTSGTVLYSRNVTNVTETIDSVLATSTTGAMTITFTSGYYAALGYELYIHCVGAATCTKPTNLQVEMIGDGTAYATWDSTGASSYRVYHHASGDSVWNMLPTNTNSITFTGLPADVNYDFYVVAYCSATDISAPSIIRHFNTHWVEPCYTPENLAASNINSTTATLSWTGNGNLWDVAIDGGATVRTANNPYTFTNLVSNTQYCVRVRSVCDTVEGRYSEWSDTLCFTTQAVYYTITVTSNNEAWGTVSGGGSYAEGSSCTIKATPATNCYFVSWQDGITGDERTFTVTADATYVATFGSNAGISDVENGNVTLAPNPASTMVTISGIEGMSTVSVVDLNGREVYKTNASGSLTMDVSGFAKGAYFVRITGERTTAIRKLIVR